MDPAFASWLASVVGLIVGFLALCAFFGIYFRAGEALKCLREIQEGITYLAGDKIAEGSVAGVVFCPRCRKPVRQGLSNCPFCQNEIGAIPPASRGGGILNLNPR